MSAEIDSAPTECSSRSTPTTIAPSCSKRAAVAAPIPPAAPVITHTLSIKPAHAVAKKIDFSSVYASSAWGPSSRP